MTQIEQQVRSLLGRHPEVEKCQRLGLVNRRALARFMVTEGAANEGEFDAVVATLRRIEPERATDPTGPDLFPQLRIGLKDGIVLLDFEKEKALFERLDELLGEINYDRGETLKIVVGTASLKLILDRRTEVKARRLFDRFTVRRRTDGISEISLTFPEEAMETPGILSVVTREFVVHDITIAELLTSTPELLVYLRDEFVPAAYGLIRSLQAGPARPTLARRRRG